MKKQKKQNTNKGITLIALVITIIVMLILVAVTITMAVNGGLFEYASNAGTQTNAAIDAEQVLANGRIKVNNLWYDSLDAYIANTPSLNQGGTEIPEDPVNPDEPTATIEIGDYISNYPVAYNNVPTLYDQGYSMGYKPLDNFIGWRVLSKETDVEGNVLYVKLISAGVPICYYHNTYNGDKAATSVVALTTNFLTTGISSIPIPSQYNFYNSGFIGQTGDNLGSTFANDFTDNVQALTKADFDKAVVDLGGNETSDIKGTEFKNLLAVPSTNNGYCAVTWLATSGTHEWMKYMSYDGEVLDWHGGSEYELHRSLGVRPVVTLNAQVQFEALEESEWINQTPTWKISMPNEG